MFTNGYKQFFFLNLRDGIPITITTNESTETN